MKEMAEERGHFMHDNVLSDEFLSPKIDII